MKYPIFKKEVRDNVWNINTLKILAILCLVIPYAYGSKYLIFDSDILSSSQTTDPTEKPNQPNGFSKFTENISSKFDEVVLKIGKPIAIVGKHDISQIFLKHLRDNDRGVNFVAFETRQEVSKENVHAIIDVSSQTIDISIESLGMMIFSRSRPETFRDIFETPIRKGLIEASGKGIINGKNFDFNNALRSIENSIGSGPLEDIFRFLGEAHKHWFLLFVILTIWSARLSGKIRKDLGSNLIKSHFRNIMTFYTPQRFLIEKVLGILVSALGLLAATQMALYMMELGFLWRFDMVSNIFKFKSIPIYFVIILITLTRVLSLSSLKMYDGLLSYDKKGTHPLTLLFPVLGMVTLAGFFLNLGIVVLDEPSAGIFTTYYIPFFSDSRIVYQFIIGKGSFIDLFLGLGFHIVLAAFLYHKALNLLQKKMMAYPSKMSITSRLWGFLSSRQIVLRSEESGAK